jgi:hypothetical protein
MLCLTVYKYYLLIQITQWDEKRKINQISIKEQQLPVFCCVLFNITSMKENAYKRKMASPSTSVSASDNSKLKQLSK